MKKAEAILAWAVEKMEERYSLLAMVGVRHINSYNDLGQILGLVINSLILLWYKMGCIILQENSCT